MADFHVQLGQPVTRLFYVINWSWYAILDGIQYYEHSLEWLDSATYIFGRERL